MKIHDVNRGIKRHKKAPPHRPRYRVRPGQDGRSRP